jgi:hypothetical protein
MPALTAAQETEKKETTTLTGEVVDVSCYLAHGAKGEGHKKCAEACAKLGGGLGILTSDGKLYISLLSDNHKSGPNAKLMKYIAKQVSVKGEVHSGAGVNGIEVESVAMAK